MELFEKPRRFGDYQLYAKVAEGAMVEVFFATSQKKELDGQFLAVKKLLPNLNLNQAFVKLLVHEAKMGLLLQHPGISQVIDLGVQKNEFFIAMEYIHGKSLNRFLQKIRMKKAPLLGLELSSFIFLEITKALAFAHNLKDLEGRNLNIIHQDLSPGNILVEYTGRVKLSNFGIAAAENRLQTNLSSAALDKLVYLPPEQAVNDPAVAASDLYSLGIVYYELLTGKLPFETLSPTDAYRKILDNHQSNIEFKRDDIPNEIQAIIQKLLEKSPKKRYQSALDLFHALNDFFINHFRIDFREPRVRDEFRKKIAQYARRFFEKEIVEEIQVVREVIQHQREASDLKETGPIQPPPRLAQDSDSEDSAPALDLLDDDVVTRHFPLLDRERASIVSGVPTESALEKISDRESTDDVFELISVTSYNQNFSSQIFQKLPLEARIETVQISRDEKETLKQKIPVLKIEDANQLDDFEKNTFSGKKKIEKPAPRKSVSARRKNSTTRWRSILIWSIAAFALGFMFAGSYFLFDFFSNPSRWGSPKFLPTQQISIAITGESDLSDQRSFFENISAESGPLSIRLIENFYNREYEKYQTPTKPLLKTMVHPPQALNRFVTRQEDFAALLETEKIFDFLRAQNIQFRFASDANLIVYLISRTANRHATNGMVHYEGPTLSRNSIVFIDPKNQRPEAILRSIAAELARIYGATRKMDTSGLTKIPEGLAQPHQSPLFPQAFAELMAAAIPLGLIESRPPQGFNEIIIGRQTAQEIGWIE
jgi:serine/threonine protein kinase